MATSCHGINLPYPRLTESIRKSQTILIASINNPTTKYSIYYRPTVSSI